MTMAMGACFAVGGLVVGVLRQARPEVLGKLARMKQTWGDNAGWWVHFVSYTVMPIFAGAAFLYAGSRGVKIV